MWSLNYPPPPPQLCGLDASAQSFGLSLESADYRSFFTYSSMFGAFDTKMRRAFFSKVTRARFHTAGWNPRFYFAVLRYFLRKCVFQMLDYTTGRHRRLDLPSQPLSARMHSPSKHSPLSLSHRSLAADDRFRTSASGLRSLRYIISQRPTIA